MKPWLRLLRGYEKRAISILGLRAVSALFEGFSLSLFIPLLYSFSLTLETSPSTALPAILGHLFEPLMAMAPHRRIQFISGILILGLILKAFLGYAADVLNALLQARIRMDLRKKLFQKWLNVHYGVLLERQHGKLMHELYDDVHAAANGAYLLVAMAAQCGTLTIFLSLLVLISWKFTLLAGGLLLLSALGLRKLSAKARQVGESKNLTSREVRGFSSEVFYGARQVILFGAGQRLAGQYGKLLQEEARQILRGLRLALLASPITEIAAVFMVAAVLVGSISFGFVDLPLLVPVAAAFVGILMRLLPLFSALGNEWVLLKSHTPSLEIVLMRLDEREVRLVGRLYFEKLRERISYQGVHFSYRAGVPVLSGTDLSFLKGQVTAIVGPSGAGKSTIVDLLVGLYEPTEGKIWVDGVDLKEFQIHSWRKRIGYVSQDTFIFHGTVRENIAFSDPGASEERIRQAAQQADADSFIQDLPQGYQTMVGERGLKLSGGQRQKIAIARALLPDPEILIFDEATSSLDRHSEEMIQRAMKQIRQHRTVIIVAHRLSTVVDADKILLLEKGRVTEEGTHAELLAKRGSYWRLYRASPELEKEGPLAPIGERV